MATARESWQEFYPWGFLFADFFYLQQGGDDVRKMEVRENETQDKEAGEQLYQDTYDSLGEKLRVSPATIRALVRKGKIPVLRCGKHHRFHYASVLAGLKN